MTTLFRSGHVALVGRPNVGKSSLLNAFVGAHLGAVSAKPHTTRQRLLGVRSFDDGQIAFLDTPGMQQRRPTAVHKAMDRAVEQAFAAVDLVVLVVEAGQWKRGDDDALARARQTGLPIALAVNKIDLVKDKPQLLPYLDRIGKRHDFVAVLLVGARKEQGTEEACRRLVALLPEREALYEPDTLTDRSERHLAAELVREQLMRQLGEEVPYACAVEVEQFVVEGARRRIAAIIWVERDGQKAIVIGEGGERIKRIGTKAREEIERLLEGSVHLELWVKVRPDWSDSERALRRLGFD
ncbi:MAG: GTPase Era [Xanthomonadales bacterium]|nr:GTPase Era [Xanthomonadales bacterium]MCC6592833.1 GTPase Era [Xanthomonadales bacterium]MCE7931552.1 GTPase Era [Xanthomonadales bacterium PRO6]